MVAAIVESISTGIVSNYIFSIISANAPHRLKKLSPALFFGGTAPLAEAERAFQEARSELLEKYHDVVGVQRFLSEKKLKGGALNLVFDNIFRSKPLVSKDLDRIFYDCFDSPSLARSEGYQKVIDDIVTQVRRALLARQQTAPFVIESSLSEIKRSLVAVSRISEAYSHKLLSYSQAFEQKSTLDDYSRYYLSQIKEYIKSIFINGLEMLSKKERIAHLIGDAYVPILVQHVENSSTLKPDVESRIDAFEVVREARRLIVRGPAGCGKTTLMQWLIWNADPFSAEPLKPEQHKMFPLYIPLRRLESAGTVDFTIDSILYNAMPNEVLKRDFPKNWLDSLVSRGIDVIVLIDGIDEIAEKNRPRIWRLVRTLSEKYPYLRLLITSRHISTVHLSNGSYRPELFLNEESYQAARALWNRPDDFYEFVVSPLSNGDIVDLIDKWFDGVDPNLVPRSEQDKLASYPDQLKKALFERTNGVSLELARTPLLCSLICLVFFLQRGRLPKNRKQLYELSTQLLIETRDEHKGVRPDEKFTNFNLEKRIRILRSIALIMQEGSESVQADQSIEVAKSKVVSWIEKYLQKQTVLSLKPKEYLDFLVERCSLIREPSANRIDFVHRSFMEYLAAEEMVHSKEAYQVREKILLDEWWNTLTFCMSTNAGGSFFGSMLLKDTLEYLMQSESKNRRKFLVKALSLVHYLDAIAPPAMDIVKTASVEVLPPLSETESSDLAAIPVEILADLLDYKKIELLYSSVEIERCVDLMCQHEDEEVRQIFLSGYTNIEDRAVIKKINQTGRIAVSEHHALFRRLQNRSYSEPVYLSTNDLRDRDLRSGLMQSVWIKLPVVGEVFIGWDFLHRCREVRLMHARQEDLEIMFASINTWRFESCKSLTIVFGHGFNFELIASMFPEVETIALERSSGIHLDGLVKMTKLQELWFENCTQVVHIEEGVIPKSLRDVVFYRSVNPIVKSKPNWLQIHNERLSKDNILLALSD